ncbi:SsrA-binding protein SmpB [Hymenobacter sp. UV11]|uniref:SsrA-binding protein SmpB n=1 Tax=Hymenobacter sp. UV11 TaxID=1849735 RepID=UPI00105CF9E2|nr:SsrA-binding protein SmpB [Hymenobacter sp. UV11]TDN37520.1 SsrA-binding protein [Hymenobacter sp. UV11]TFZ68716.1 SsrA-binding protein SmpB [Hymenobacter sp. UV11]
MKDKTPANVSIKNRRASHEYTFLAKYDAGMMLQGTEIKSVRASEVNLQDGYCTFDHKGDLWVHSVRIAPYTLGTYNNHDAMRARKLLLNKRELKQLAGKMDTGLTIIPLRLFVTDRGFAKLEIALAQGKKLFDKREDLKAKDQKREMERFR